MERYKRNNKGKAIFRSCEELMKSQNQRTRITCNKAGYTATLVTCVWAGVVIITGYLSIWAGAVMHKPLVKAEKVLFWTD